MTGSILNGHTVETVYADAVDKARRYHDLSRRYAAAGQPLPAVYAAWAGDLCTVQAVMWERVMAAAGRPDDQFFAAATTVARALAHHAVAGSPPGGGAGDAVHAAREAVLAAFDPAARSVLADRLPALDHLHGLDPTPVPDPAVAAAAWLDGDSLADRVAQHRQAARDGMAVAAALYRQGDVEEALRQAWLADWAAFEGYLLEAAQATGDEALVTVDLRWALACEAAAGLGELPPTLAAAVAAVRDRLTAAVGPVEGARLRERFAAVA